MSRFVHMFFLKLIDDFKIIIHRGFLTDTIFFQIYY